MTEVLVIGATGKTGRRITRRLVERGVTVRAAARNPGGASDGVEPVRFDWDDAATWHSAVRGVDAVYVIPPALRADPTREVRAFVEVARASGDPRIVFLSARGVDVDDAIPLRRVELDLEASGARFVVLRPTWFAQNFTEGVFAPAPGAEPAVVAAPAGDGAVPFVDVEDIADVAVAALLDDSHDGRTYELSGPEPLTHAEVAAELSALIGRDVVYVDVEPDAWRSAAIDQGLPTAYADLLVALFGVVRAGYDAHVSNGTTEVLGRPARSFRDAVADAAPASPLATSAT